MSNGLKLTVNQDTETLDSGLIDLDVVVSALKKRCPSIEEERAVALAHVWKYEIDSIIREMVKYTEEKVGFSFHIQLKEEVVFELVRLGFHLVEIVVDHKLKSHTCDQLDPQDELVEASSLKGQERIRNTARNFAEGAWIKFTEAWHKQTKRLLENEGPQNFQKVRDSVARKDFDESHDRQSLHTSVYELAMG